MVQSLQQIIWFFVGDGSGLTNVTTDTTDFKSGSDLHQILKVQVMWLKVRLVVFVVVIYKFLTKWFMISISTGSLNVMLKKSYVVSTNTGSFLQNSDNLYKCWYSRYTFCKWKHHNIRFSCSQENLKQNLFLRQLFIHQVLINLVIQ